MVKRNECLPIYDYPQMLEQEQSTLLQLTEQENYCLATNEVISLMLMNQIRSSQREINKLNGILGRPQVFELEEPKLDYQDKNLRSGLDPEYQAHLERLWSARQVNSQHLQSEQIRTGQNLSEAIQNEKNEILRILDKLCYKKNSHNI